MKHALLALALAAPVSAQVTISEFTIPPAPGAIQPAVIFLDNRQPSCWPGTWCEIVVPVPEDAKAVYLTGGLIITPGTVDQTCYIAVGVRATSHDKDHFPVAKAVATKGQAVREQWTAWVPVEPCWRGMCIAWKWDGYVLGPGLYSPIIGPPHCSMGINAFLAGWGR